MTNPRNEGNYFINKFYKTRTSYELLFLKEEETHINSIKEIVISSGEKIPLSDIMSYNDASFGSRFRDPFNMYLSLAEGNISEADNKLYMAKGILLRASTHNKGIKDSQVLKELNEQARRRHDNR